jgi:hypothetical protein
MHWEFKQHEPQKSTKGTKKRGKATLPDLFFYLTFVLFVPFCGY